jgi:hypothetical protein
LGKLCDDNNNSLLFTLDPLSDDSLSNCDVLSRASSSSPSSPLSPNHDEFLHGEPSMFHVGPLEPFTGMPVHAPHPRRSTIATGDSNTNNDNKLKKNSKTSSGSNSSTRTTTRNKNNSKSKQNKIIIDLPSITTGSLIHNPILYHDYIDIDYLVGYLIVLFDIEQKQKIWAQHHQCHHHHQVTI